MLLKDTEAAKLAAISRTSVWRWARNNINNFPKLIRIGNRSARWVKADIDARMRVTPSNLMSNKGGADHESNSLGKTK